MEQQETKTFDRYEFRRLALNAKMGNPKPLAVMREFFNDDDNLREACRLVVDEHRELDQLKLAHSICLGKNKTLKATLDDIQNQCDHTLVRERVDHYRSRVVCEKCRKVTEGPRQHGGRWTGD